MSIEAIAGLEAVALTQATAAPTAVRAAEGFGGLLDRINELNAQMHENDRAVQTLALGETDNLHQVMMNMEKTRVGFQLVLQVRNKMLDAYHELMRMQV